MQKQCKELLWSDRWSIENNEAWFVAGDFNVLFHINMITNHYEIITALPGKLNDFRKNSNCIKCEETIFCLPDTGHSIWCYHLISKKFCEIRINTCAHTRLRMLDFWRCGNILWVVSIGLKQILEIDIEKKDVVGYYNITNEKDDVIARSAKDGNSIYTVSARKGIIYEFDINRKTFEVHRIPEIEDRLHTISVKEGKVWMSGWKKAIYIWEKETRVLHTLQDFPQKFGVYDFEDKKKYFLDCESKNYDSNMFIGSMEAGDYIWFIPFQTSQILYVNKNTDEINSFEIKEEDENEESLKNRHLKSKYVLQYINENRYIGLYSDKNQFGFEIDALTMEMKVRSATMNLDDKSNIPREWIFEELMDAECSLYKKIIGQNFENEVRENTVGERIFDCMR